MQVAEIERLFIPKFGGAVGMVIFRYFILVISA